MHDQPSAEHVMATDPDMAEFFLGRFASLMIRQLTTKAAEEQRVLGQALLSTYGDCVTLGLDEQVFAILDYINDALPQDDAPVA